MSKLTKHAIMNSFLTLLNRTSFDNITVKDIVDECGISRNTFYYNFEDIYALVDEIMQEEMNKIVEQHKPYRSWKEGFLDSADFALQNKRAIIHLHHSSKRYELEKYLKKVVYHVVEEYVTYESEGFHVSQEDQKFVAEFYMYALLGLLDTWIETGMKQDLTELIDRTSVLFENNIKQAVGLFAKEK